VPWRRLMQSGQVSREVMHVPMRFAPWLSEGSRRTLETRDAMFLSPETLSDSVYWYTAQNRASCATASADAFFLHA